MLVTRYIDKDGNRNHVLAEVTREKNGKYYIMYNPRTCPCYGGYYDTLKAAEEIIERLRPTAKKLNSICFSCKTSACFEHLHRMIYSSAVCTARCIFLLSVTSKNQAV